MQLRFLANTPIMRYTRKGPGTVFPSETPRTTSAVAADQDLLFGRIALNRKYCTQAQLDEGVAIQARSRDRLPLGQILLGEGYITQDQHSEILAIQRRNLAVVDPVQKLSKESLLLGKLALRDKLMSERDVNLCLRLQAKEGEKRSIGELMVEQGFLTPKQLDLLLAKQQKRIMSCPACKLSFTVLSISKNKLVPCPRCKGALRDGKASESVRTDAQLDTSVARRMKKESAPPPAPQTSPSSSVRMVKMTCPICAKVFHEPVDSKGRVDCPSCFSSFTA
jgi:protein-arginine kinase activator protein McsA